MKLSHILSIVCLCISASFLTCGIAQLTGGVESLKYLNTFGYSAVALGLSFVAWPHGYKQHEEDTMPPPPGIHGKRGEGRKV